MNRSVVAIVPAAGAARRFGGDKLLAVLDGEPLLDHTLKCLLSAGIAEILVVAAEPAAFQAVVSCRDQRVRLVVNPSPWQGMFSSVQCALRQVPAASDVLVLPGDMPFVRADTVANVLAAGQSAGCAAVAVHLGRRGHPLFLPSDRWARLIDLAPQSTLKVALAEQGTPVLEVAVSDPGVLKDVDHRSDLPADSSGAPHPRD
jgi:molybdenum cofactor cytidylyltransferase